MKPRHVLAACLITLLSVVVYNPIRKSFAASAAGTMTTYIRDWPQYNRTPGMVKRVELDWTADTATSTVYQTTADPIIGRLIGATLISYDDVTSGYTIQLIDEDNANLFDDGTTDIGDAVSTATEPYSWPGSWRPVCGYLNLSVSATTGTGRVVLYYE